MLKKQVFIIVMVIMSICMFSFDANAQEVSEVASGTCGDNIVWNLDSDGLLTISGNGKMDDYDLKKSPWYPYASIIKNVNIDSDIENVGEAAFYSCDNVTDIILPNSLTTIGDHAFAFTDIKNIILPSNLNYIGGSAFCGCSYLESINIPDSVINIGDSAFIWCKKLRCINIPDSVTSIGNRAFWGCDLTDVRLSQNMTEIEEYTFYCCSSLERVIIPDSITSIGKSAFYTTKSTLKSVFYSGTSTQWDSIFIEEDNDCLTNSIIHYSTTDHIWNSDYTIEAESTCAVTGSKSIHCSICDAIKDDSSVSIPVNENHNTELRNEKEPTYVSTGYTGDLICTVCGKIVESGTVIPMKERIEATGKFALLKSYLLEKGQTDDDGNKYFHDIVMFSDKIGAIATITYIKDEAKFQFAYGDINNNSIVSTIVMLINENGSETVTVDYSYNIFSLNASATFDVGHYVSGGKEYFEKTSANILDNSEIQDLCNAELKAAFTGWDIVLLKNFGFDVNMADMGFISYEEAGTHTWDSGKITTEATCEKKGVKTYTCVICGCSKTEDIAKTNIHNWDMGVITKEATTTNQGEKTYTCTICKMTRTEIIPKIIGNSNVNNNNSTKKSQTIKVTTSKKISAKKTKNKVQSFKLSAKSTSGNKVKYKLVKGNKNIKFAASSGKITVKKGTKKGTYKIKVKMTVSKNAQYKAYSVTKTITIKVK